MINQGEHDELINLFDYSLNLFHLLFWAKMVANDSPII